MIPPAVPGLAVPLGPPLGQYTAEAQLGPSYGPVDLTDFARLLEDATRRAERGFQRHTSVPPRAEVAWAFRTAQRRRDDALADEEFSCALHGAPSVMMCPSKSVCAGARNTEFRNFL